MSVVAGFMVPHPPMIIPEIGRGSEAQIEDTIKAYERVADEIAELAPETIIISSPHAVMYEDYFHISPGKKASGSFERFRVPEVSFNERYDEELTEEICRIAEEKYFPAGTLGERDRDLDHGTMVPLWFIRNKYKGGHILRLGLSGFSFAEHYRYGMIIKKAIENLGKRAVFVASGDLSHKLQEYGPYGFVEEGPEYDRRIMDVMGRGAFSELLEFDESFCDRAAECGHRSFVIMAGAFDGVRVRATALSHQDVTGVGYGICTFYPLEEEPDNGTQNGSHNEEHDDYVRLAKQAIECFVLERKRLPLPDGLPEEMLSTRAGAFVSIHKNGDLRGCIGTIGPIEDSVASEIISNAISACSRDPRFYPVRPGELEDLEINVDVLGEPEDIDSEDMLDVKRYGVIVSCGRRRGLLLPDLDGVDTVRQQVDIAMQKGGIRRTDDYSLQRFEVIRHY